MEKINFYPFEKGIEEFAPPPVPASKMMPDWFRSIEPYMNGDKHSFRGGNEGQNGGGYFQNSTAKKCLALFDTLVAGYYLLAPADIYFEYVEGGEPIYKWRNDKYTFVLSHPMASNAPGYPLADHLDPVFMRWLPMWMGETPPGYSTLVTHPIHRNDLPFTTMTGIIDTDKLLPAGALPFNLHKGFKGIIKKGTPIAQIIPFKRDEWEHEIHSFVPDRLEKEALVINSAFSNVYKDNFWEKKSYN